MRDISIYLFLLNERDRSGHHHLFNFRWCCRVYLPIINVAYCWWLSSLTFFGFFKNQNCRILFSDLSSSSSFYLNWFVVRFFFVFFKSKFHVYNLFILSLFVFYLFSFCCCYQTFFLYFIYRENETVFDFYELTSLITSFS